MTRRVQALVRSGQFLQQMDPDTSEFSPDPGAYSPAMVTLFDLVWRLYGVRSCAESSERELSSARTCRLNHRSVGDG
jgi:hypothetical protein